MDARKKLTSVVCCLSCLILPVVVTAQTATDRMAMQTEITALLDSDEASAIAERLAALADDPVRLNSAREEEIARLFFLTEFQVKVLADYIRRNGSVVTIYEIAMLPGFDRATAMMMEPYVSLTPPVAVTMSRRGRTTVLSTAMYRFTSSADDTSGFRPVVRINHQGPHLSFGLTAENDPGERYSLSGQPGFDFLSAHIMYESDRLVSRIIAGDYSLRFGEGLVFNSNSWQGGWLTSPSFMAGRTMTEPYTSTDENRFFRGAAVVLGSLTGGAVLFLSSNAIDARVRYDDDGSSYISNMVSGGLHNTLSGREAHDMLTENIAGSHVTYGGDRLRAGITAAATFYSLPLRPDTTNGINMYKLSGDRLVNTGIDARASLGKIILYGEAGYSSPGSWAAMAGMRAIPTARVTVNIMTRHLSPSYHAPHSSASGAGNSRDNETGIAGNILVEAAPHLFVTAGADIYRHPWLSYRSSAPSSGVRTEVKAEYTPSASLFCRLGYSLVQREYDVADDTGIPSSEEVRRHQLSFLGSWTATAPLTFTTRAVWCYVPERGERGYTLCQDVTWDPETLNMRLWIRYALFTTDGWDSRIYAYENDMLRTSSIPPLYGNGTRAYLMAEWNITPRLLLRAKYSVTATEYNMQSIFRNEVRVQIKGVF